MLYHSSGGTSSNRLRNIAGRNLFLVLLLKTICNDLKFKSGDWPEKIYLNFG